MIDHQELRAKRTNTVANIGTAAARHRHARASPRSAARPAASRSAAPNSAPSRWSSPPRASGSRSATACRPAASTRLGATLRQPGYKEASRARQTPISGFVDGPALQLVEACPPRKRLRKPPYLRRSATAIGSAGRLATAKLIAASAIEPRAAGVGIDLLEIDAGAGAGAPPAPRRARLHRGRARYARPARPAATWPPLRRQGGGGQGARPRRLRPGEIEVSPASRRRSLRPAAEAAGGGRDLADPLARLRAVASRAADGVG